jgi:hypothetical protein
MRNENENVCVTIECLRPARVNFTCMHIKTCMVCATGDTNASALGKSCDKPRYWFVPQPTMAELATATESPRVHLTISGQEIRMFMARGHIENLFGNNSHAKLLPFVVEI